MTARMGAGNRLFTGAVFRVALLLLLLCSVVSSIRPAQAATSPAGRFFWVARSSGWAHLRLNELAAGPHVHLYAPGSVPAWQAQDLVTAFETHIFPTDTRLFGFPASLAPLDIALVPLDSVTLGYFDQNDVTPLAPGTDSIHSNRANVLFARLPSSMPDRNKMADTEEVIAHELQHLIEYRARVVQRHLAPQDDWLNEGLSFFAQIANGYWTPRDVLKVDAACGSPSWPVTSLNQGVSFLRHDARIAYGRAGLFVTYLAGRFGLTLPRRVIASAETGVGAVDGVIRALDARSSFGAAYADWGVAQYLRTRGPYGFGAFARTLSAAPQPSALRVSTYPFDSRAVPSAPSSLHAWGQSYLQFSTRGGQNVALRVDAPTGALRVAAVLEDSSRLLHPKVVWVPASRAGTMVFKLNRYADSYDRVTLVLTDEPRSRPGGGADGVRVRAMLVNAGDNN